MNCPALSHRLLAPILKYLQGRGLLLRLEAREALQHIISLCIWLAVAVVSIFAGWLLLATTLVGVPTHWLGWSITPALIKSTILRGGLIRYPRSSWWQPEIPNLLISSPNPFAADRC